MRLERGLTWPVRSPKQNPCCSVCALMRPRKQRSQKCVRTVCFLSFELSRCNADERYLNDRADRGEGSAQQRCCHQGCRYHPRVTMRTHAGLEKQLRLQPPFSPGQSVSKSCVLPQTGDMASGHALRISFSPSTCSLFALSRHKDKD